MKTPTVDYDAITKFCDELLAYDRPAFTDLDKADQALMRIRDYALLLVPTVEEEALKLPPQHPARVAALLGLAEAKMQLRISPPCLPINNVIARAERLACCCRALVKHHSNLTDPQ